MTEEVNEREPKTFGFNRGFIGRVVAIGLFVALGTFAVTQSLTKPKTPATPEEAEALAKSAETESDSTKSD
ncbi:MAG: hypothetical protein ABL888_22855, partial [Pirellulaceae bacterium]